MKNDNEKVDNTPKEPVSSKEPVIPPENVKAEFKLYKAVMSALGVLLGIVLIGMLFTWLGDTFVAPSTIKTSFMHGNPLKQMAPSLGFKMFMSVFWVMLALGTSGLSRKWLDKYVKKDNVWTATVIPLATSIFVIVVGGMMIGNYNNHVAQGYANKTVEYINGQQEYQFRGIIYEVNALKDKGNRSQHFTGSDLTLGYKGDKKNNYYYAPTVEPKGAKVPNLYSIRYMPMRADGVASGKAGEYRSLVAEIKPADKQHAIDTFITHKDKYGNMLNTTVYLNHEVYLNANRVRKGQDQVHKAVMGTY